MNEKLILLFGLRWLTMFAEAQSGSIIVTSVQQHSDGSGYVDVYFNLSGPGSAYNIAMQASFDGDDTYTAVHASFLSRDVNKISPGTNKHIVWDGLSSHPNTNSIATKLKIIVNPN